MNPLHPFGTVMPVLCQTLLQAGIRLLLQSSLLLLGLAAGYALRRSGPSRQLHIYQAALGAIALCILLSFGLAGYFPAVFTLALPPAQTLTASNVGRNAGGTPAESVPSLPASASHSSSPLPSTGDMRDVRDHKVEIRMLPESTSDTLAVDMAAGRFNHFLGQEQALQTSLMGRWYMILAGIWLGVAFWLLLWLLFCYAGIYRICRRAQPVHDPDLRAQLISLCAAQAVPMPDLRVSRDVDSVFLAGVWRPILLLPACYATVFDPAAMQAILAHEVMHLRAREGWWNLTTRLLCALLWMQPLLWWLNRLREQASEEACDLAVVAQGCSPRTYADCLLTLAGRLRPSRWEQVAGGGSVVFRSSLAQRIHKLMSGDGRQLVAVTRGFRMSVGLGSAALALLLTLAVTAAPLQAGNMLGADTRLDRKAAITAEGAPIGDLLALLMQKTGVDFSVSADLADKKIVVFGPPRPLRAILSDMAALFNATWLTAARHDGRPRYVLVSSVRTQEYEQRLAGDTTQRVLAKLDEQIQALDETPDQLAKRPPNDPIRQALSDSDGRMATSVLASFSPQQRRQLVERCFLRVPVGPLDPALKDQLQVLFHGKRVDDFNEMVDKQFHGAVIPNPSFSRVQMEDQELDFTIHDSWGYPGPGTDVSIDMGVPTGLGVNVGRVLAGAQFLVPAHGNPYTGLKIAGDAPLPDPNNVQAAQSGVWVNRLRVLSEKTGTPVISDYYRSKPILVAAGTDAAESRPPLRALDAFCLPSGYLWWNRGKTLLFRKRDWYTQQLYEVPDRWVLAMSRHLKEEKGVLTLGDALSVLQLSTEQIAGLNATLGWRSDRLEMAGLREMLAVIEAMHLDVAKPLYSGVVGGDVMPRQVAIMPDLNNPIQRDLLYRFMQARERTKITPKDVKPGDFGFILMPVRGKIGDSNEGAATGIDTMIYPGRNSMTIGYRIALPLILPDDRRDKTKVEVGS